MSRIFQNKNKDLANLKVVSAKSVWTKKKNGKYVYSKNIKIFGKVDKGTSAFVTNTNTKGLNNKFIEDTTNLPKKIKNEIVKHLYNGNRVAYLIVEEKSKKK